MLTSEERIRALPCWHGPITIGPLSGGLSNENYLVTDAAGRHVVRFGQDYPFHHVFREREVMAARAAHQAGFAPAVRYSEPGVMVTAFLGAKTSAQTTCAPTSSASRPGAPLPRRHAEARQRPRLHVLGLPRHPRLCADARPAQPHGGRAGRLSCAGGRTGSAQVPLPIVFGHNDLLPANILDDGDRLWLIDFEYAGFSTAMFDLAGVASNAGMDAKESEFLGRLFRWPRPRSAPHAAMQCASLLREAMWSMVSELHLDTPGVDYALYRGQSGAARNRARQLAFQIRKETP